MQFIDDRSGRWEKAKWGESLGVDKRVKQMDTHFSSIGGDRIVNDRRSQHTETVCVAAMRALWSLLGCEIVPCTVWPKEIILTFQKYAVLDAQRESTSSLNIKIDFCEG